MGFSLATQQFKSDEFYWVYLYTQLLQFCSENQKSWHVGTLSWSWQPENILGIRFASILTWCAVLRPINIGSAASWPSIVSEFYFFHCNYEQWFFCVPGRCLFCIIAYDELSTSRILNCSESPSLTCQAPDQALRWVRARIDSYHLANNTPQTIKLILNSTYAN